MEQVTEVAGDTDSHTSVVLCRVLLKRLYGVNARMVEFDARERVVRGKGRAGGTLAPSDTGPAGAELDAAWPRTVLLIGDKVVTDAPPAARYPHQMDLGEAWKELTGLPFVYAVWMCRADRAGDESLLRAAALLDRQRRHNRTRLDWIVSSTAAEHRWAEDLAAKYLGSLLRYDVGEREREAVRAFLAMAHEDGLVKSAAVRWVEGEPVGAA